MDSTTYTQVISVDLMPLINPKLRIHHILNHLRPAGNLPAVRLWRGTETVITCG